MNVYFADARSFLEAVPTAELEPITETYVQSDEVHTRCYLSMMNGLTNQTQG